MTLAVCRRGGSSSYSMKEDDRKIFLRYDKLFKCVRNNIYEDGDLEWLRII